MTAFCKTNLNKIGTTGRSNVRVVITYGHDCYCVCMRLLRSYTDKIRQVAQLTYLEQYVPGNDEQQQHTRHYVVTYVSVISCTFRQVVTYRQQQQLLVLIVMQQQHLYLDDHSADLLMPRGPLPGDGLRPVSAAASRGGGRRRLSKTEKPLGQGALSKRRCFALSPAAARRFIDLGAAFADKGRLEQLSPVVLSRLLGDRRLLLFNFPEQRQRDCVRHEVGWERTRRLLISRACRQTAAHPTVLGRVLCSAHVAGKKFSF